MFARLFPAEPKKMVEESLFGILKSMILLPIPYYAPDVGEGISGMYANLKIRMMFPLDEKEREIYREKYLNGEFKSKRWQWQLALQHLLADPYYDHLYTILIAPIMEELVFRGLLMPFISYGLKAVNIEPSYSIILSALAFGLGHKDSMKLPATCSGYLWGSMTASNNGSLWASIGGHISQNAINTVMHYYRTKPDANQLTENSPKHNF